MRWAYRIVRRPSACCADAAQYELARVTFHDDGTIYGWEDAQPLHAASLPALRALMIYAQPALALPVLAVDAAAPGGLRPITTS